MSREQDDLFGLRRKRERRKKLRTVVLSIVSVVLVALLIAGLLFVLGGSSANIRLAFFNFDSIQQTIIAKGLIVREEVQLSAPVTGSLFPLYHAGSKVSNGDQIATVFLPGQEDIAQEINNLKRQIYHRQTELARTDFTHPQIQKAKQLGEAEVLSAINSARLAAGEGAVISIERVRTDVEQTINYNSDQLRWLQFDDAELLKLQRQYKTLIDGLKNNQHGSVIKSTKPGWISYRNWLTSVRQTDLLSISKDQLLQNINSAEAVSAPFDFPETIERGDNALTLITGQEQYLAFFLPGLDNKDINDKQSYTISSLTTDVVLNDCQLLRQEEVTDGLLVVFKTRQGLDRLANLQLDSFRITLSEQSGLIMPVASLLDYVPGQGAARIMKVIGGKTQIVPVIIEATDGFYVLIRGRDGDPLAPKVADIYVRNPEQVEAGVVLD